MNKSFLRFALIILVSVIVNCSQKLPPERKAIRLVKKSHALGGKLSTELTIKNWLKERKDEVKPLGWEASKKSEQIYLVSFKFKIYTWEKGSGERGYFFLVDVENETVRNVTNDYELELKPLSPPFKDENEIPEPLIEKLIEEEEILSGKQLS